MPRADRFGAMTRILSLAALLAAFTTNAQEALWLREPAISPDGKTILFCYQGDIWRVPARGVLSMDRPSGGAGYGLRV